MIDEVDNFLKTVVAQYSSEDGYGKACLFMLACIEAKQDHFSKSRIELNAVATANKYWRGQLVPDSILTAERCACWKYHDEIRKNHQPNPEHLLSLRILICTLYPIKDPAGGSDYLLDVLDNFIDFFTEKFPDSKELILSSLQLYFRA
ncbi:MAG: hypothetical protein AAF685_16160 [Cyanobacteria bacterium P01_C01_bin.89]